MNQQQPDPARPRPRRATAKSKTAPGNAPKPQENFPARPAPDDRKGWEAYWKERQQPWRTEPEINVVRQQELATCYAVPSDIEKGIYPFRGMKLSRADVEWLLATYGESFTAEEGLDVRGADLNEVDLRGLPLSGLRGGLTLVGWWASEEQLKITAVQMNNVLLIGTQLQGADLRRAHLKGADLSGAQLQGADLGGAQLQGADFTGAQLERADLYRARLERANLNGIQLERANLSGAILADLQGTGPHLVDVRWDGVNLAVVDWSQVKILRNEYVAHTKKDRDGKVKEKQQRLHGYQQAVRANRQLAVVLQAQGLNEDAARFAYRANVLQRKVLWFQMVQPNISLRQRGRKLGAWVFSHFLNLLAGYGYRPERSFLAYLLVIFGFMGLYLLISHFTTPHLRWDEALVLSLSSFHGRGFFTQTITLGDPYARLAVTEAVLGLFIEISFIATFTQRFFGK